MKLSYHRTLAALLASVLLLILAILPAHADDAVHSCQRCHGTQSVAADVSGNDTAQIAENFKSFAMRTTGAELGRFAGSAGGIGGGVTGDEFADAGDVEFAEAEFFGFVFDLDTGGGELFKEYRIAFVDNQTAFDFRGEVADSFDGQGVGHAQFEDRSIRRGIENVVERDSAGDDAQFGIFFDNVFFLFTNCYCNVHISYGIMVTQEKESRRHTPAVEKHKAPSGIKTGNAI